VNSLELVLLLLVEVAHLRQNFRVTRHFRDEDIVPLEGLATRLNQLVHVSNLINDLIRVGNNRVQLLKSLQRFVIVAKTLVD